MVWSPHSHSEEVNLCELDIKRCRKNALLMCVFELPVLCHFDNIVPATPGHLVDFNYVFNSPVVNDFRLVVCCPTWEHVGITESLSSFSSIMV